nr:MFS transporter [Brooklawnia cerclae]
MWIINVTAMLTYYSLMVSIGPYVTERYGASPATAGLVAGVTVIGILVARAFSGYLWTRFTSRQLLAAGVIAIVPVVACYGIDGGIGLILVLRLVHGLGVGLIGTVSNTAVVFTLPPARRGEGIGYFTLSNIVATAIGPFGALLIVHTLGYRPLFWIEVFVAVAGLLAVWSVRPGSIPGPSAQEPVQPEGWLTTMIEPATLPLSFVMMWVSFGYAAINVDLALMTAERGLNAYSSVFFLVYAIIVLASRPWAGRLMDARTEHHIVYPAMAVFACGLVLIGQAATGAVLLVAAALCGLGFGNIQSAFQTAIARTTPLRRLGQANSTYFIFFDLTLGVGPYLLGLVIPTLGYRRLFDLLAVVVLVGIPLYYVAYHARQRSAIAA